MPRFALTPRGQWFSQRYPERDIEFARADREGGHTRSWATRCGCGSCADDECTHVAAARDKRGECVRCGCYNDHNAWGERTCFCDTCHVHGCSTQLFYGAFDLPGYVANGAVDLGQCYDCFGYRSAYEPGPVCPHCQGPATEPIEIRECDGGHDDEDEPCYSCGYEERRKLPELGLLTWPEYRDAVMDRDHHFSFFDHRPAWDAAPIGQPRFRPRGDTPSPGAV